MNQYTSFVFDSYRFDSVTRQLELQYRLDKDVIFTETYLFDFEFAVYDQAQLDRALQNLFFMAGVSYYKACIPRNIEILSGELDDAGAAFFSKTYQRGLGEFYYVNQLDPRSVVPFTANTATITGQSALIEPGLLVGIGGGKDSLVSIELLRSQPRVATWSLGHAAQLAPLVQEIGLPHYSVRRDWDPSLLKHNAGGALNGHVPISAIFACVGTVVSILAGYQDSVVSNENSANEPTLVYQGLAINHQYSKSLEFEQDYQSLLQHHFGKSLRYFSLLRPFSELRIAELFASHGFEKYNNVFSSCNRAFVHTSHAMSWCGECPKCAFVFLALTPFIDRPALEMIWNGKNLLLDKTLDPLYRKLLGIEGDKPLECVGEIKESRAAMRLAQQIYPDLDYYRFDLPEDYDYRKLAPHSMPAELYQLLLNSI